MNPLYDAANALIHTLHILQGLHLVAWGAMSHLDLFTYHAAAHT